MLKVSKISFKSCLNELIGPYLTRYVALRDFLYNCGTQVSFNLWPAEHLFILMRPFCHIKYRWRQKTCGPFVVRCGTFAIKSELKELAHNSSLMSELKTLTKFDVKKFFELSSLTKT